MNASRFRRPQFTLWTLLLAVTAIAAVLGIYQGAQRYGYEHARGRDVVIVTYNVVDLVKPVVPSLTEKATAEFGPLIDLIKTTIVPESWETVGGTGSIVPFETNLSLVVTQRRDIHVRIEHLLKQLRRLKPSAIASTPRRDT
jgi:hypothetical protein